MNMKIIFSTILFFLTYTSSFADSLYKGKTFIREINFDIEECSKTMTKNENRGETVDASCTVNFNDIDLSNVVLDLSKEIVYYDNVFSGVYRTTIQVNPAGYQVKFQYYYETYPTETEKVRILEKLKNKLEADKKKITAVYIVK